MPDLIGCDFSSSPTRRKPVVLALGQRAGARVVLQRLEKLDSLLAFAALLAQPQAWVGGFDFPFGLPRELVQTLGWPMQWHDCITHYAALSRADIRDQFAAFCNVRPAGGKFGHRATARPDASSPTIKTGKIKKGIAHPAIVGADGAGSSTQGLEVPMAAMFKGRARQLPGY